MQLHREMCVILCMWVWGGGCGGGRELELSKPCRTDILVSLLYPCFKCCQYFFQCKPESLFSFDFHPKTVCTNPVNPQVSMSSVLLSENTNRILIAIVKS